MESHEHIFFSKPPLCSVFTVSVIIPTHNAAQYIAATLESVLAQINCKIEIVIIDANSTDRTVEIIHSYRDPRIRLQQVPTTKIFEMMNRGVGVAQGEYVHILRPGDAYIFPTAISTAMWQIAEHRYPDLLYTASFFLDEWNHSHFLFRPLSHEQLRQGKQPTNLQSCWIKKEVFKKIGLFDKDLYVRGGFDFFARFLKEGSLKVIGDQRAYVDPVLIPFSLKYLVRVFKETFYEIVLHYGFIWACGWLFKQRYLRHMIHKLARRVQWAFSGR
jgi:glycosyltransferase involved in cell wall biosynthesis